MCVPSCNLTAQELEPNAFYCDLQYAAGTRSRLQDCTLHIHRRSPAGTHGNDAPTVNAVEYLLFIYGNLSVEIHVDREHILLSLAKQNSLQGPCATSSPPHAQALQAEAILSKIWSATSATGRHTRVKSLETDEHEIGLAQRSVARRDVRCYRLLLPTK